MLIELDAVRRTVGLVLGLRDPQADQRLIEDLGAESVDVLALMVAAEQEYGVSIDETAIAGVSTVRDLHRLLLDSQGDDTSGPDARRSA